MGLEDKRIVPVRKAVDKYEYHGVLAKKTTGNVHIHLQRASRVNHLKMIFLIRSFFY